jgi:hypothetical protein
MHINEQSPRVLRRQLKRYFPHVHLWFSGPSNPATNLLKPFSRAEMRAATDLYAVASHVPVDCGQLARALSMQPLAEGIESGIKIEVLAAPANAAPASMFTVRVRVSSDAATLRSDPPYPVLLSSHWLNQTGGVVVFEGLRNELTPPLKPGSPQEYKVSVLAPNTPGPLVLRLTLLQELVRWFDGAGAYVDLPIKIHE